MAKMTLFRRLRGERGSVLLETALTLPIMLLVSVGIFEFGRAYQTWQVLTNAAREGARVAVLPGSTTANVQQRVHDYMNAGQLAAANQANVAVSAVQISIGAAGNVSASQVTVSYPFNFLVLNPVARLVVGNSNLGAAPITLTSSATMRNEQ